MAHDPAVLNAALALLARIDAGETRVALIDDSRERTFPVFMADGWTIVVFNDAGEFDYIESLTSPEGVAIIPIPDVPCPCDYDPNCALCNLRRYHPPDEKTWMPFWP